MTHVYCDDWHEYNYKPLIATEVFERKPVMIDTRILDADGELIRYRLMKQPINFIHFNSDEFEDEFEEGDE